MLLTKYLKTINNLNPDKIYVENVRSMFKIPTSIAKLICEMAVVDKALVKKIGIVCPNSDCNRIIASFNSYGEIPEFITCDICELEGKETYEFESSRLEKIIFYQLAKRKND